jgi:hypothetical protein
MKHASSSAALLSAVLLLSACGGVTTHLGGPSSPPTNPPGPSLNITGNWEFSTTSTAGTSSLTIAGNLTQTGSSVVGEVHVDGSNCFDQNIVVKLTGTSANRSVSLISAAVDGQVLTIAGSFNPQNLLTGTYVIDGGCADGDRGQTAGSHIGSLQGYWAGYLTTAGGRMIHWETTFLQDRPTAEGSFGLNGSFGIDDPCMNSGTITSGTFPSASYTMGRSLVLEIKADNGTMTFVGTTQPWGLIEGNYTITGNACGSTGTAYLSPWGY